MYVCECIMDVIYACWYVWNISHGPVVKPFTAADSK